MDYRIILSNVHTVHLLLCSIRSVILNPSMLLIILTVGLLNYKSIFRPKPSSERETAGSHQQVLVLTLGLGFNPLVSVLLSEVCITFAHSAQSDSIISRARSLKSALITIKLPFPKSNSCS